MSINLIKNFSFVGDDREDFQKALRTALELSFRAGRNENPEYHSLEVMPGNHHYWSMEEENFPGSTFVCAISQRYGKEDESFSVKMNFKSHATRGLDLAEEMGVIDKDPNGYLKWTKESYDELQDRVMFLVDQADLVAEVPDWMEDGDGSVGKGFGFVFRASSPDVIFVFKTHIYYGK